MPSPCIDKSVVGHQFTLMILMMVHSNLTLQTILLSSLQRAWVTLSLDLEVPLNTITFPIMIYQETSTTICSLTRSSISNTYKDRVISEVDPDIHEAQDELDGVELADPSMQALLTLLHLFRMTLNLKQIKWKIKKANRKLLPQASMLVILLNTLRKLIDHLFSKL